MIDHIGNDYFLAVGDRVWYVKHQEPIPTELLNKSGIVARIGDIYLYIDFECGRTAYIKPENLMTDRQYKARWSNDGQDM